MTLVKQDPACIESECIANAVEWILGMQNQHTPAPEDQGQ